MIYKLLYNFISREKPKPTAIKIEGSVHAVIHGNEFIGDMNILDAKDVKNLDFQDNLHYIPKPENIGRFWNILIDIGVGVLIIIITWYLGFHN